MEITRAEAELVVGWIGLAVRDRGSDAFWEADEAERDFVRRLLDEAGAADDREILDALDAALGPKEVAAYCERLHQSGG